MCNKAYSDKSNLEKHKCIHSGEHCYPCEIGNKAFSQQSSLNIHQHMHNVEGAEKCLVLSGNG